MTYPNVDVIVYSAPQTMLVEIPQALSTKGDVIKFVLSWGDRHCEQTIKISDDQRAGFTYSTVLERLNGCLQFFKTI